MDKGSMPYYGGSKQIKMAAATDNSARYLVRTWAKADEPYCRASSHIDGPFSLYLARFQ